MNSKKLRLALRANAIFSFTTGSIMVLAGTKIAQLFDISQVAYFTAIGAGLLVFALYVLAVSFPLHINSVKSIIWGDWGWVAGSNVILVFNPFSISGVGKLIIIVIAVVVAIFALLQMKYSNAKSQNVTDAPSGRSAHRSER